jgi:hypothetical protein
MSNGMRLAAKKQLLKPFISHSLKRLPAVFLEDLSAVLFIRRFYGGLAVCFR